MVALPTLYPIAPDGTVTTMAAPVGANTHADAMRTNDGDTSYSTSGVDSAGSVFVNLDDTPADFATMDSLTVSCIVRLNGTRTDDTTALYAQVFTADETTALTDEIFVTDHTTGGTYTVDSTALVLSAAGTTATKADWDGARLKLRWAYTKTKGSDAIALWVTQSYLDGAYTASGPTQPVANAGPYQIVAYSSAVTLDASASTGGELAYSWEQISGTAVTLTGATTANPTFTAPSTRGQMVFRVTTTNSVGTSTDDVIVGTSSINIRTREQWEADESQRTGTPTYYPMTHSTLLHTASLSTNIADFDQYVRDLYYTHAVTNAWGDIGYNFLVAPNGTIYEGRWAGNDGDAAHDTTGNIVTGKHSGTFNEGNLGVALILDGDQERPAQAAIDSLTALWGEQAARHGWDTQAISNYTNPAGTSSASNRHNIAGRLDWGFADETATNNPGLLVYPYLPYWRREAARLVGQAVLPPQQARMLNQRLPIRTYDSKPWQAANGSWYMFTLPAANEGHIQAMKSPDRIVWHPIATAWAKGVDAVEALISIPRGDGFIDVWVQDAVRDVTHNVFDAGTDTWGTGTLVTSEPSGTTSYISGTQRSDGMQFVQVTDVPLAGGEQQIRGIRRVGTTFYHHTTYDGGETQNFFVGPTVLGDVDRIHNLYSTNNTAGPRYYHRAWTTAETFPARDTLDNTPYAVPGPLTDTNGAVRIGTDVWTVFMDSGGMALKRFISKDNITPNADELVATTVVPDFTNDIPRLNLTYSPELGELIITYSLNGVPHLAKYNLAKKAWGQTVTMSVPPSATLLGQMPIWDGEAAILFYRANAGDVLYSGNYVKESALTHTGNLNLRAIARTSGTGGVTKHATISMNATAYSNTYVFIEPTATAGSAQIGMRLNEEFYGIAAETAANVGKVTMRADGSNMVVAVVTTSGLIPASGVATTTATAQATTTGSTAIASTASYLVVGEAEKIATIAVAATATTTAVGAGNTYASTTMIADAATTIAGRAIVSGTIGMAADATTTSASSVSTTGALNITSTASTVTVAFQEKFGTLTASAIGTQATVASAGTTSGAIAAADSALTTSGAVSTTAAATLAADASMTAGATSLATPTGLTATPTSPTEVTLDWSDVADATSYDVERDTVIIARVTASNYIDTGLSPETSYTYRVRSVKVS